LNVVGQAARQTTSGPIGVNLLRLSTTISQGGQARQEKHGAEAEITDSGKGCDFKS
jgi:hypothetical protein